MSTARIVDSVNSYSNSVGKSEGGGINVRVDWIYQAVSFVRLGTRIIEDSGSIDMRVVGDGREVFRLLKKGSL